MLAAPMRARRRDGVRATATTATRRRRRGARRRRDVANGRGVRERASFLERRFSK
jgi:hypothetical protein